MLHSVFKDDIHNSSDFIDMGYSSDILNILVYFVVLYSLY